MFNHERCSLSGSTVYPGVRFGVSLKLIYPETDLLAESFCCRSCWLHASCGVESFNELLPGSNNRLPGVDSCWKIPYVVWCITKLGKVQITKVPWVGCKRPCSKEPCIDSQEGEKNGGGSGLDYVILLSEGGGLGLDYGWLRRGGGVKKCQKIDYVICERPLIVI